MDILFLSHCVPNPPDKGERIRAHFESKYLARKHNVHLVCFGRSAAELDSMQALSGAFASMHGELLSTPPALAVAAARFAAGGCLNMDFYASRSLQRYVNELARRVQFSAAVAFSVVMAPYVPAGLPYVLEMLDVDSEKWFQYSRSRRPGFLYATEGRRLRRMEVRYARAAARTILTTRQEELLFRSIAAVDLPTAAMENGVDFDFYDPAGAPELPELKGRRFLVFIGSMEYFPNADAVISFAKSEFPEMRKRYPDLEFFIVGRNPGAGVLALRDIPGVTVTGGVRDTRAYLSQCVASVTPLRIARGIQNKVLESLAMGKPVLASPPICKTFGESLPVGIFTCSSAADYCNALESSGGVSPDGLRQQAHARFTWDDNLQALQSAVEAAGARFHY